MIVLELYWNPNVYLSMTKGLEYWEGGSKPAERHDELIRLESIVSDVCWCQEQQMSSEGSHEQTLGLHCLE